MPYALSDRQYRRDFTSAISGRQPIDEQERRYYVPITDERVRGDDLVSTILETIDLSSSGSAILVGGPHGSGKSSELLRLREELKEQAKVDGLPAPAYVYVDVTHDYIREDQRIDAGSLLVAITAGLIENAHAADCDDTDFHIDQRTLWQKLLDAFKRLEIGLDKVSVDAGIFSADLKALLRDDTSFRAAVAKVMLNNRARFRFEMHQIIEQLVQYVSGNEGPAPVFVIDSLDHLRGYADTYNVVRESVERLFEDYGDELTLPMAHVIYCVPSYVETRWAVKRDMLNIQVYAEDYEDYVPGLEQLRAILEARAPKDGGLDRLFGTDAEPLNTILRASGGSFRDLFRLVGEVIVKTTTPPASHREISRALATLRDQMVGGAVGMSEEQMLLLRKFCADQRARPTEKERADYEFLEIRGALLRYPDGPEGPWTGVHPLLRDIACGSPR